MRNEVDIGDRWMSKVGSPPRGDRARALATSRERSERRRRARVRSPCRRRLKLAENARCVLADGAMFQLSNNATLIYREDLSPDLCIVRVALDSGAVPAFEPGQFATLGLPEPQVDPSKPPKMLRRPYSIASAPQTTAYLEFYLSLIAKGSLTPKLWLLHEGGRLYVSPVISGSFTLDVANVDHGKDVVTVSTGTGLAPFVSMVRAYRGTHRWRRFVVIHGVRQVADLGYRSELEAIAKEDPSVIYVPMVTREPWPGLGGRTTTLLADPAAYTRVVGAPLTPSDAHVLLCGNPDMVEEAETLLEGRGFRRHKRAEPGNLHAEKYW